METTLEVIRKRTQQQQNAVLLSQLSTTEKKRRLKRLKELLARLKRGDDITRRDLKSILSEKQCKLIDIYLLIIQKACSVESNNFSRNLSTEVYKKQVSNYARPYKNRSLKMQNLGRSRDVLFAFFAKHLFKSLFRFFFKNYNIWPYVTLNPSICCVTLNFRALVKGPKWTESCCN